MHAWVNLWAEQPTPLSQQQIKNQTT